MILLPSFRGDTSLTMTMALADSVEEALLPLVQRIDPDYASDDRILAWLYPPLRPHIRKYYHHNGPCLCELATPQTLEALDKRLCWELGRRLEQACPGILGLLSRKAER